MNALTIAADETVAALSATVLASLPVTFAPAEDESSAAVRVIDGSDQWSRRAAELLSAGHHVLVVDPSPQPIEDLHHLADREDLHRLADPQGSRLVLDLPWAGNPALSHAAEHLKEVSTDGDLLEVHAEIGPNVDPSASLLDISLVIGQILQPLDGARLINTTPNGSTLLAVAGSTEVVMTLNRTETVERTARLRLIGSASTVEVCLPDPRSAQPAEVTITTGQGSSTLPTYWESSHRTAWRQLHAPGHSLAGLDQLLRAQSALREIFPQLHP